jgi:hypothetical protein
MSWPTGGRDPTPRGPRRRPPLDTSHRCVIARLHPSLSPILSPFLSVSPRALRPSESSPALLALCRRSLVLLFQHQLHPLSSPRIAPPRLFPRRGLLPRQLCCLERPPKPRSSPSTAVARLLPATAGRARMRRDLGLVTARPLATGGWLPRRKPAGARRSHASASRDWRGRTF